MNMVLPDEGLPLWSQCLYQGIQSLSGIFSVVLYQNAYTPVASTHLSDFVIATFPGHAAIRLEGFKWSVGPQIGSVAYITYSPPPQWVCTGGTGQLVYGWAMLIDHFPAQLVMAAQRFNAPHNMVAGAAEILNPFRFGIKTLV